MFSGLLFIFIPLIVGYLISVKNSRILDKINQFCSHTVLFILFLMGLSIAGMDNLGGNIKQILTVTACFFVSMSVFNLIALPFIDAKLPLAVDGKQNKLPLLQMASESLKLVVVVALGVIIGLVFPGYWSWVHTASEWTLFVLLFLIGIQLRNSGLTLREIIINKHGLIIASAIVITSWLGGIVSALLLDLPLSQGLAMASGFGWYSLTGILITDNYGPLYGSASLIVELLRELVALIFIPMLIKTRPCTAIGYAGATAMDFTLPVIQQTGGIRCVPVAIVSGFILSLLVPILILTFSGLGM
ncbi:lysine exporter LysO family protein [Vibrio superstes]|uniref:Membrane protein n=1 Tax=Vibrio superstes NBRC 103154 TaxID=1219062 RepID=A0A511QQD8_9VIBR|nr:lysine exporter LysO family protein [Vibrio superstes]GEM79550.1 membrane protein [Vibrio superstes NBRC 103154]